MATAFDNSAPFDGQSLFEDDWRAMQRRVSVSGVVRNQLNELRVYGDSTGRQVKMDTGEVWIESYAGQITSLKTISIDPNTSGSTRLDLIVARANWGGNQIEYDVIKGTPAGTPVVPPLTRNTAQWEIPLAIVRCVNGFSTLNVADVTDARQWGGPPVTTVTDDFLWWGDRISTCSRFNVTADTAVPNSNIFVARMHSLGDQTVSTIRLCPTVLPVGGTTTVRIFRGYRQDQLTTFVDPTTSNFLYGGSAGQVHSSAIPTTTFRAGEVIVIAIAGYSTTTQATLAVNTITFTGIAANFLNPSMTAGPVVTAFKTGTSSMPTSINLLDGTWTARDRVFWTALA